MHQCISLAWLHETTHTTPIYMREDGGGRGGYHHHFSTPLKIPTTLGIHVPIAHFFPISKIFIAVVLGTTGQVWLVI